MATITPTPTDPIRPAGGNFQVLDSDNKTVLTLSFSSLLIHIGLKSLESSRSAFQTQFTLAQNKVGIMQELNKLIQEINNLKTQFKKDAASTDTVTFKKGDPFDLARMNILDKYVELFLKDATGFKKESAGPPEVWSITKAGLEGYANNCQTAQSTLSSENEQQSMRTNQAMNRSSGFLQQLQSMLQSAKEAMQAASKAGSAS